MEILLVIIIILLILTKIKFKPNNTHRYQKKTDVPGEENNAETNYEASNYQRKWMFTYNEKDIYKQLKSIAHQNGLELFAKVRLLDLVEPKSSVKNKLTSTHGLFFQFKVSTVITLSNNSLNRLTKSWFFIVSPQVGTFPRFIAPIRMTLFLI